MNSVIKQKLQNLLTAANTATGESDTDLTGAVQTLVDGYGQGGGTAITDGIVVKARNKNGYATEVDFYKDDGIISSYQFSSDNASAWYHLTTINIMSSTVALTGSFSFRQSKISQSSASALFAKVSEIYGGGRGAFYGITTITEAILPNCTRIVTNQCFRMCTNLQILRLPVCTLVNTGSNEDAVVPQLANLTELTVGSIGYPYMFSGNGHFLYSTNNANLVATFYVGSGANADRVLAIERPKSTTATIIIKAANALEYNGTSYSAGDTILTSEVTA